MHFSPSNANTPDSPRTTKPRRLATYLKLNLKTSQSEGHSPDPTLRGGIPSVEKDMKYSNFRGKIPLPFCRVNCRKLKIKNSLTKDDNRPQFGATLIGLSDDNLDQTHDGFEYANPEIVVSLMDDKLVYAGTKTSNQLSDKEIEMVKELDGGSIEDLNEFLSKPFSGKPSSSSPVVRNVNLDYLADDDLIRLAIEIFKKAPEARNTHELRILTKCMAAVDFFKRYDQNTVQNCLKNMYYVNLNPGDIVFEMGEYRVLKHVFLIFE